MVRSVCDKWSWEPSISWFTDQMNYFGTIESFVVTSRVQPLPVVFFINSWSEFGCGSVVCVCEIRERGGGGKVRRWEQIGHPEMVYSP